MPLRTVVAVTFLPRDATQSAVLQWQVVCPSVRLSVCLTDYDVEVSWVGMLRKQFGHIYACFYALNVNNNRRVVGCRAKHAASRGFLATSRLSCSVTFGQRS